MMIAIGILLILTGIAMLIIRPRASEEEVMDGRTKVKEKAPGFILWFNTFKSILFVVTGVVFLTINGAFFYAVSGKNYYVEYKTGTVEIHTTPGYKMKWWGRVTEWDKNIAVLVQIGGNDSTSHDENSFSAMFPNEEIMFNDNVTADINFNGIFKLPEDPELFKDLVVKYKTERNMVHTTIVPTVKEIIFNSAYTMGATDYITGGASDFRQLIVDQLKNGQFSFEKREDEIDTVSAGFQSDIRSITGVKASITMVKRADKNGKVIRIAHNINHAGLETDQANVGNIELNGDFKSRLTELRKEATKRQLEIQMTKTAKEQQDRIIAEGEVAKASIQIEEEKKQLSTLIAVETQEKAEKTKLELAKIALETTQINTKAQKIQADADAYAKRTAKDADGSLELRLQYGLKETEALAKALEKVQLPTVYQNGGGGNSQNGGDALQMMLGMMLRDQAQANKK